MTLTQHLRIRQGETWSYAFIHTDADGAPVDLSSYSARMSIRTGFGLSLEACLSTNGDANQGDIALTAQGGVTLFMTADQTTRLLESVFTLLQIHEGDREIHFTRRLTQIYDLELISASGVVTRALQGEVIIERGVYHG